MALAVEGGLATTGFWTVPAAKKPFLAGAGRLEAAVDVPADDGFALAVFALAEVAAAAEANL